MAKPRKEVIQQLSTEALKAMDGCGIDDITPAEVVSAAYTLCRNMTLVMLSHTEGLDRERNREQILNAIVELYDLVKPEKVN